MSSKRGRGRGGSRSVSKEFLKRSAAESGLDSSHLKDLDDIITPPLYPDFHWKSTGGYWDEATKTSDASKKKDPSGGVVFCINRQRKLLEEFRARYHHFETAIVDVARVSDPPHLPADQMVLCQFSAPTNKNRKLELDTNYIPAELLLQPNLGVNSQGSEVKANVEQDDSEREDDEVEEELGGEDYTTNYYASDNDTDDDEGEATF